MQRKTVTVLFCDVTGSTALGESVDPEALRGLLARYFERMKAIVERHGGSVEKFIGDAVMAVFGVPVAHEDDALRAVRAAAEMRDALPDLGIRARIGVNTGEVVTGTEERLATGDAVNVAARLEQAAEPNEVLIGEPTFVLVKESAEVEPVDPLELKGKTTPVTAYRLLRVHEAPERRHETAFVGRERELALLREAWEKVQMERRCELVTIVGDAGVGKSRLVAELLGSIEGTVASGRCLPYGEGITYWPVVEVLKQLDVRPPDEAAAGAVGSLLGESEEPASAEDIAWAFRKTLEHAAAAGPLVVVFDDIQWAEETFLDLIDHVALLSSDAPILLLCLARPELLERRSAWPVAIRLDPLGEQEIDALIPQRVGGELRQRIARAAGGNPLFVHEMVAMAGEAEGEVVVPPTLRALLTARLDQLEPPERGVLECGAVEGEVFHRGAVQALASEEPQVTPRLATLVRKQLIRPDKSQLPGDDGFRFRHLLIRDAAYEALPKAARADLHQRFAAWLEDHGSTLVELDEILGYHLEQAVRYRDELGQPPDANLSEAGRQRLTTAGRRAYVRSDFRAAGSLLERAGALLAPSEIDLPLEVMLAEALFEAGRGSEALQRARSVAERASATGDRVAELCARVQEGRFRLALEPEGATERLLALLEEALPVFETAGDDVALYMAYFARGESEVALARMDDALEAFERAVAHARNIGVPPQIIDGWRSSVRMAGTTPTREFLAWVDEQERNAPPNAYLRRDRATALAQLGRFDEARALLADVAAELADRGADVQLAVTWCIIDADAELTMGNPAAAAEAGERGCRLLDELGEQGFQSSGAGFLGQALYALGRLDEAEEWAERAVALGASDDALTQMLSRQVRAKVEARRGDHAEAERLGREAVAIGDQTDMLNWQADTYVDLGEVLLLAGRRDEAAEAFRQALERYERKGNIVLAERTRERLAKLEANIDT